MTLLKFPLAFGPGHAVFRAEEFQSAYDIHGQTSGTVQIVPSTRVVTETGAFNITPEWSAQAIMFEVLDAIQKEETNHGN